MKLVISHELIVQNVWNFTQLLSRPGMVKYQIWLKIENFIDIWVLGHFFEKSKFQLKSDKI